MEFAQKYQSLHQENIEIIAVSSDTPEQCSELRNRLELPFTPYADPECEAIRALGIYHEDEPKGRHIARPSVYVLDAEHRIRYRYVGESSRDRPDTGEVVALARST